jgi:hypothetical protein
MMWNAQAGTLQHRRANWRYFRGKEIGLNETDNRGVNFKIVIKHRR